MNSTLRRLQQVEGHRHRPAGSRPAREDSPSISGWWPVEWSSLDAGAAADIGPRLTRLGLELPVVGGGVQGQPEDAEGVGLEDLGVGGGGFRGSRDITPCCATPIEGLAAEVAGGAQVRSPV